MFGFNFLIFSEFFALRIICVVMVLCIKPYLHFFFFSWCKLVLVIADPATYFQWWVVQKSAVCKWCKHIADTALLKLWAVGKSMSETCEPLEGLVQ